MNHLIIQIYLNSEFPTKHKDYTVRIGEEIYTHKKIDVKSIKKGDLFKLSNSQTFIEGIVQLTPLQDQDGMICFTLTYCSVYTEFLDNIIPSAKVRFG